MKSLEALKILYPNKTYMPYYTRSEKRAACEVIEKDLEVLDILKKHCINDGWSNGYLIRFWEMNANELKKVKEWWLKNE